MGITGKYSFSGIQKYGAIGLTMALSSTAWGAWLVKIPVVSAILNFFMQQFCNWLANKGLIILNITASVVEGSFDQAAFDVGIDNAITLVEASPGKVLTKAQQAVIDDAVIKVFRAFAPLDPA